MAKRKTRQLIVDRLESSARLLDRADDNLAQAIAMYYKHGAKEGAELELIRQGVEHVQEAVKRFRYTRA